MADGYTDGETLDFLTDEKLLFLARLKTILLLSAAVGHTLFLCFFVSGVAGMPQGYAGHGL